MSNKRRYGANNARFNPRRGGPGILLTCETGRERKCQNEGFDILDHYWEADHNTADNDKSKPTSLEDEISQLKDSETRKMFGIYETGCRGTLVFLCTAPDCALIPPFQRNPTKQDDNVANDQDDNNDDNDDNDEPPKKKIKQETVTKPLVKSPPLWDPVDMVRHVLQDLRRAKVGVPGSRFVTRMIPLQATCFANQEEIKHVARQLFAKFDSNQNTFAIQMKRRNCNHLTRDTVIEWVAKEAPSSWKVNLKHPKITVVIEICKTLCGISIIKECAEEFGNFNLVETREKQKLQEEQEGSKKEAIT